MDWDELLKVSQQIQATKPDGGSAEDLASRFATNAGIKKPTTTQVTKTVPVGTKWWEKAVPKEGTTVPKMGTPVIEKPKIWGTVEWLSTYDDPVEQRSIATNIGTKLGATIRKGKTET